MIWYKEKTERLYEILETSEKGLSKTEASERLEKYGENQLAIKKDSIWRILSEPFRSVFLGVLAVAAIISLLSDEPLDAAIIGIIITVNSCIYYSQQYATSRVLRSLKKHSIQQVQVIRDGDESIISSVYLVPGDIIVLNEGERVPADARIIHTNNLQVNEASLTGESVPVHKHASTLETTKQIYEQDNMVFQGTYVLAGTARALVVETASRTEFGKIAILASDERTKSPVQTKIDHLVTLLIKVVGVLAIIVFVLSLVRGIPSDEALRFVLSLAVSAVPEGLPVALTVIIILGMRRMAKQKALVRNFKAIEDIGLITTIATDKTGTLTKNHLTIVKNWSLGITDVASIMEKTIDISATQADPLDRAIVEGAKSHHKIDKLYVFDLALRMSGAYIHKDGAVYVKGSPEHILSLSNVTSEQHHAAESEMHEMASKGYRVIAFGIYCVAKTPPEDLGAIKENEIELVGFVAFADEIRQEAARAIGAAHEAGISVRLITGDHYETAYNIGKQIGLASHFDQVIKGTDLPKETHALTAAIQSKTIFARILPEDKFRILKALKQTEITAMTGDGVNDVPALANAHVGIAMGSGSDIARDASGIVLLNDNFATIIKAIAEGRKIFDNIRRMLFYLLSTSLGEVLTMIGALLFGLPLPVTAIQILWINLVTDTAMVLPLGLEPEEAGHMKRPPRHPKDPLLSKMLLSRMGLISLTMAVVTLIVVFILVEQGQETVYIQTVAFMTLIAAQWMNAFNARSEYKSSFSRIAKINFGLIIGFAVAFSLQMLVMFGPLKTVFGIQQVPIQTLLLTSGIMVLSILVVSELHKFAVRVAQKNNLEV
ncbi:cation-transporting P-type ATPase [Candidatus Saccharibacteria bacterium]|nr:cation-transporting P-type ATPase [Candidatus Saccharibacteria bacterium]